jgi:hypothetical protein
VFVRKRTTRAGSISTALVEAYRDHDGRPRHRILANLHGEPDVLSAIAKLARLRDALWDEQDDMVKEVEEISGVDEKRQRVRHLLPRFDQIEATVPRIDREVAAIRKYCSATDEEFEVAYKAFAGRLTEAARYALGVRIREGKRIKDADTGVRRLTQLSFKRGQ